MKDILQKIRNFFIRPGVLFETIAAEKNLVQGLYIWCGVSILSYVPELFIDTQLVEPQSELQAEIVTLPPLLIFLFGIFVAIIIFFIMAGVLHLSARLCQGKGEFKALLTCLLFMSLLSLVSLPFMILFNQFVLPGLMTASTLPTEEFVSMVGPLCLGIVLVGLLMGVWGIVLTILILRKCYMLSVGKATLAFFLPLLVVLGLLIILTLAVS